MLTNKQRLEQIKMAVYELQHDLSVMIDTTQETIDLLPEYEEAADTAWNIVSALKDATISLEEAMDNIQTAIDESEEIE